ncbi:MAG: UDP-N-acetylmuramoyl-L-alanine--D-glutamate ligase [bacterium]|nr:UDP-N-acetylmuramoyl-L-alanine--D-glutamate ligase [bacterium]
MKIAILGNGITAKSVENKLKETGCEKSDIEQADIIVASPGIPPQEFPSTNKEIISEIELAYRLIKEKKQKTKIIAVTGTNGKTTVTSLIAHLLKIPFAGNIGIPFIDFTGEHTPEIIVLELSSYQLELCTTFKPDIAIFLNVTQDHLKRHKTMENYAAQKARIFQNQQENDHLIYNEEDAIIKSVIKNARAQKHPFSRTSEEIKKIPDTRLKGMHNKLNILAAWHTAKILGQKEEDILAGIKTFLPLEHRIEEVLTYKKRIFYNDSKATNNESTIVAVNSFDEPVNLILGGVDKGLNMESFLKHLIAEVKSITVYGEIARRLYAEAKAISDKFTLKKVTNLEEALDNAFDVSEESEIILFSPACSSFDQFDNFEHRGQFFKSLVKRKYGK